MSDALPLDDGRRGGTRGVLSPAMRRGIAGMAAPPGTGPRGKSCRSCANLNTVEGHARYGCCMLREPGAPAINPTSAACSRFEAWRADDLAHYR